MATGPKTPSDQIDEVMRLVENSLEGLQQVLWALKTLKVQLAGEHAEPT